MFIQIQILRTNMRKIFALIFLFFTVFCWSKDSDDIDDLLFLFNSGKEDVALNKAEKILSDDSYSKKTKYNVFVILNEFYYQKRNFILALDNAKKMVAFEPDNAYGYFRAGDALLSLHKQIEACEYISKSIELDPSQPKCHLARGIAKYELFKEKYINNKKNTEKNETYYEELDNVLDDFLTEIKIDNNCYYSRYMAGFLICFYMDENIKCFKELTESAIYLLNTAIEIKPNFINSYFVLASLYGSVKYLDLEKCYQNANKYIELIEESKKNPEKKIEKLKEFDDLIDRMYFLRGEYYRKKEKYELALKDYDVALSINPSRGIYYFNKIKIYRILSKDANEKDKKRYETLIKENMKLLKEKDPDFNK